MSTKPRHVTGLPLPHKRARRDVIFTAGDHSIDAKLRVAKTERAASGGKAVTPDDVGLFEPSGWIETIL
eukprot:scaffold8604_cov344-Pinguiococcus_pyrenoidosus.AAC.1